MNSQSALRKPIPDYLSVIHKSQFAAENDLHAREDLVLQTDLHFNITGLNGPASVLFERPGTTSRNLFEPGEIETVNGSIEDIKSLLFEKGYWTGQLCHRHFDGDKLHYKTTATVIKNEKQEPTAVLLVCTKIEDEKEKETELAEAKKQFEGLLNTLSNGVMMIDAKGNIISSNRRGAEILGLEESKIIGQPVAGRSWKGIRTLSGFQ
jgi:PAS domain-containing protein